MLGLLVAPSRAGLCLAAAALLAFLARTPLKLVLVDRWRGRRLRRTGLAARVGVVEIVAITALVTVAGRLAADDRWWRPAVVAGPLVAIELWFDMRSRSRRLVPELAGAIGVAGVVAMIAFAGGEPTALAVGLWLVLAGRALTSIPHVRVLIQRLHGRPTSTVTGVVGDAVALGSVLLAVALDDRLVLGAVTVVIVITLQRVVARREPVPAKVVGIRQTFLGAAVVAATAIGVAL